MCLSVGRVVSTSPQQAMCIINLGLRAHLLGCAWDSEDRLKMAYTKMAFLSRTQDSSMERHLSIAMASHTVTCVDAYRCNLEWLSHEVTQLYVRTLTHSQGLGILKGRSMA